MTYILEETDMKPTRRSFVPFASFIFAAALLLCGCAALGLHRSAGASATVQGVEDDYKQAQRQTEATEAALNGVAISADLDLKQSFDYFSANRELMEQIGKRLVTHADGMFYRGTFYFVESGKSLESCAFPRTGRTDDLRSIDLGEDFDAISETGGEVKRSFRAFQFDIEQIQAYLANNLTPIGVDTIVQMLRKAKVDSDSLQETLEQALTALEHAKTNLAREAQKKG
jgi:hypothetical protein